MMFTTVFSILGIFSLIAMFWVLYDIWFVKKQMSFERKIIWSVAAVFLSILTAIVYYILEKN